MQKESENNLIFGLSLRLKENPLLFITKPFFAVVQNDDGELPLSSLMTPPYPIIVQGDPQTGEAIDLLINHLLSNEILVSGVNGKAEISTAFAERWFHLAGKKYQLAVSLRLYELRNVLWPKMPEGNFRLADQKDVDVIAKYHFAFMRGVEPNMDHVFDKQKISRMIDDETVYLWEVTHVPVSMAMISRPTGHGICISGVYTPPAERKRGYASACVAHLSHLMLNKGYQYTILFTDLANPTSNHIYQAVGYEPMCDFLRYSFT